MTWSYRPEELSGTLEAAGFDVDRAAATLPGGGGSLTARRERGRRVVAIALDAGGRVRLEITTALGETAGEQELGGIRLRVTETTVRTRTLSGRLDAADDLARLLAALDAAPAASGPGSTPGQGPAPGAGDVAEGE